MKANETITQSPVILMERKRREECWHIRKAYCPFFIAHLQHFFKLEKWLSATENAFCRLLYIEISDRDFCLISYLFAALGVNDDQLRVKGIFPQKYVPLWGESITLHLCMEQNGSEGFVALLLEMKSGGEADNRAFD